MGEKLNSLKWSFALNTAGRWPWKSETAKECVTTHLPNQPALKMDGARALDLYRTVAISWAYAV
ncbi:10 kDa secreted protein [Schistosoma japonicum]|uniref:10 kDa secreted protein n=1 Tax=Schistosoma japonicum TaxID=6182 RepID=A0A4Z2D847_SCHJA|nr:10 kDa secreted protein [Schistosoma japonicum]